MAVQYFWVDSCAVLFISPGPDEAIVIRVAELFLQEPR